LGLGVAHGALIVLGDAELEVLVGFADVFFELLDGLELALDVGALAQQCLRLSLIVPEIGRAGLLV
jgi:hypothetical protein